MAKAESAGPPRTQVRYWVGAAAAFGIALALGLFHLNAKSFWLDEAFSVAAAGVHNSLHQVLLADAGNFAFYYLLLHLWLRAGDGDTWVRLLSVLFAAAAPPLLFLAGRRIVGSRAALLGAFVMACNPFFVSYAQEARGYSLLLALSILSTYFFILGLQTPARAVKVAYAGVTTLMLYTHLFGVWVVAWHAVILMLARIDPGRRGSLVLALFASVVLGLPLAHYAAGRGTTPLAWVPAPTWHSVMSFFVVLAGGGFVLAAYLVLVAAGVEHALSQPAREQTGRMCPWAVLGAWCGVPLVLTLLVSIAVQPTFVPRYLIIVLPPVALAVGLGLSTLRPKALAAACVLLALLSAAGLQHAYAAPKDDWRDAAATVAARQLVGDAIVYNPPWLAVPFEHAGRRLPRHVAPQPPRNLSPNWAPPHFDSPPGWRAKVRSAGRVWLIVGAHGPDIRASFLHEERIEAEEIVRALGPRPQPMAWFFQGIRVYLYAKGRVRQPVRAARPSPVRRPNVR